MKIRDCRLIDFQNEWMLRKIISISSLCVARDVWWSVVCMCVLILESVTFYRQRRFKNSSNHINHSILLELIVRSYRQILFHVILLHSAPFNSFAREYWIGKNVQVNCDNHIWSCFFCCSSSFDCQRSTIFVNLFGNGICYYFRFIARDIHLIVDFIYCLLEPIIHWMLQSLQSIQVCSFVGKFIFSSNDLLTMGHSFVGSLRYDNVHTVQPRKKLTNSKI